MPYKAVRSDKVFYRPGQDVVDTKVKQYKEAYQSRDNKRKVNLTIDQIMAEIEICLQSKKQEPQTSDR